MNGFLLVFLTFRLVNCYGQEYPFAKKFVDGTIILNDSTEKKGQLKWFPNQNERLRFRETGKEETAKYSPGDILGFYADSLHFVSLHNIALFDEDYPLKGKTSLYKSIFGKRIGKGIVSIYFVLVSGYSGLTGNQTSVNIVFEKKHDTQPEYVAFPVLARMSEKRYEQAKENLTLFFKDHPIVTQKIKANKQDDDFYEIINLVKAIN